MHIGLAGYGKMGRAIERIAKERGHEVLILDVHQKADVLPVLPDVIIEFTHASAAPGLIRNYLDLGIPVVSGTTGWNDALPEIRNLVRSQERSFIWAPNFSIGMHITFIMNKALASIMNYRPEYDVTIEETHHTEKKDAPSGTAIALADQILTRISRKGHWELSNGSPGRQNDVLEITAIRESDVKGTHHVIYTGPNDRILITHEAFSRDGFALGAVLAAEWLPGKTGVYGFEDVLDDLIGQK